MIKYILITFISSLTFFSLPSWGREIQKKDYQRKLEKYSELISTMGADIPLVKIEEGEEIIFLEELSLGKRKNKPTRDNRYFLEEEEIFLSKENCRLLAPNSVLSVKTEEVRVKKEEKKEVNYNINYLQNLPVDPSLKKDKEKIEKMEFLYIKSPIINQESEEYCRGNSRLLLNEFDKKKILTYKKSFVYESFFYGYMKGLVASRISGANSITEQGICFSQETERSLIQKNYWFQEYISRGCSLASKEGGAKKIKKAKVSLGDEIIVNKKMIWSLTPYSINKNFTFGHFCMSVGRATVFGISKDKKSVILMQGKINNNYLEEKGNDFWSFCPKNTLFLYPVEDIN